MIVINIKIAVARMGDNPEAKALSKTGDIISESLVDMIHKIDNLENSTFEIKEMSKDIKEIMNEER